MSRKKKKKPAPATKKFDGKVYKLGGAVKSKKWAEKHKKINREKGVSTRVEKRGRGNYVLWVRK